MHETAQKQVQAFAGKGQMAAFAGRLLEWLNHDLNPNGESLTESRARAILLAANVLDEPTRHSFAQAVESEQGMRLALYGLLRDSGLADKEDIAVLAATSAGVMPQSEQSAPSWLALAVAAFAWRADFLLDRLDPASLPDPFSPAGQVLKRAAYFIRQEVQRSATERDKLARKLAHAEGGAPSLNALRPDGIIAPLPPYYRMPIPERYPEYNREIEVSPDEVERPAAPTPGAPLSITSDDLSPGQSMPTTQPPLRIDISADEPPLQPTTQRPATHPPAAPRPANVVMPKAATTANTAGASAAIRGGRGRNAMKATKLQVIVQERPDGPGLYGLQVRISSRGIRRYVAGTTNKDGEFICELPVQLNAGLTYDVDVTWPRDFGGEVERKSITLNADRTHFTLPFYRKLKD